VKNAGGANGGMQESRGWRPEAAFRCLSPNQSFVKNLDQTFDGHQALLL
jgi:hypothetical protein